MDHKVPVNLENAISELSRSMSNQERVLEHLEVTLDNMDKRNNLKFQNLQRSITEIAGQITKQQGSKKENVVKKERDKNGYLSQMFAKLDSGGESRTSKGSVYSGMSQIEVTSVDNYAENFKAELEKTKMEVSEKLQGMMSKIDMATGFVENVLTAVKNNNKRMDNGFKNLQSQVESSLNERNKDTKAKSPQDFGIQNSFQALFQKCSGLDNPDKFKALFNKVDEDMNEVKSGVVKMIDNSEKNGKKLDRISGTVRDFENKLVEKISYNMEKHYKNNFENLNHIEEGMEQNKGPKYEFCKIENEIQGKMIEEIKNEIGNFHIENQKNLQKTLRDEIKKSNDEQNKNFDAELDRQLQSAIWDMTNVIEKESQLAREVMENIRGRDRNEYNFYFRVRDFDFRLNSDVDIFSYPWYINQLGTCLRGYVMFMPSGQLKVRLIHGRLPKLVGLEEQPVQYFSYEVSAVDIGGSEKVLKTEFDVSINESTQNVHFDSCGFDIGNFSYEELKDEGLIYNDCLVLKYNISF